MPVQEQSTIQTKPLGNSDLRITPVGYGAWAIGGGNWEFGWGYQEDQDSIAAIHRALDLGMNVLFTYSQSGSAVWWPFRSANITSIKSMSHCSLIS